MEALSVDIRVINGYIRCLRGAYKISPSSQLLNTLHGSRNRGTRFRGSPRLWMCIPFENDLLVWPR